MLCNINTLLFSLTNDSLISAAGFRLRILSPPGRSILPPTIPSLSQTRIDSNQSTNLLGLRFDVVDQILQPIHRATSLVLAFFLFRLFIKQQLLMFTLH